jgi:hypothetical protein
VIGAIGVALTRAIGVALTRAIGGVLMRAIGVALTRAIGGVLMRGGGVLIRAGGVLTWAGGVLTWAGGVLTRATGSAGGRLGRASVVRLGVIGALDRERGGGRELARGAGGGGAWGLATPCTIDVRCGASSRGGSVRGWGRAT